MSMWTDTIEELRDFFAKHDIPLVEGDELGIARAKKLALSVSLAQPSMGRSVTHDFWIFGGKVYAERRDRSGHLCERCGHISVPASDLQEEA